MKLGIVIYSIEPETVFNAVRFGNFALREGDEVKIFLLAKGVEIESIDNSKFKIMEQMDAYLGGNGRIYACGTCLKLRNSEGSEICPMSTMKDLYDLVKECDKVVSF